MPAACANGWRLALHEGWVEFEVAAGADLGDRVTGFALEVASLAGVLERARGMGLALEDDSLVVMGAWVRWG